MFYPGYEELRILRNNLFSSAKIMKKNNIKLDLKLMDQKVHFGTLEVLGHHIDRILKGMV